jgi:hypothetical protein
MLSANKASNWQCDWQGDGVLGLYGIVQFTVQVVVQMMCNIICALNVEHMPLTRIVILSCIVVVYLTEYELECKHSHTWSHQYRAQVLWQ